MSKAKAIADLDRGVILARVDIAVSPERVFRALTSDELTAWWGADGMYRTTRFAIELCGGGRWRSDGVGADGKPFHVEGEVLAVEPPRRLVYTWHPGWDPGPPTTVEYLLEPTPTGTRVTVRHDGFTGRGASCDSHAQGWERVLGWLHGFVAPAPQRYFLLRLLPPRPTFAQDMTAEERALMTEHGAYWHGRLAEGRVVAFGPVLDPKGAWGMGLVRANDEAEVAAFEAGDPVIRAERGFRFERLAMATAVH
jgi:uncharacterized protein YndB with AHSA1/START domain